MTAKLFKAIFGVSVLVLLVTMTFFFWRAYSEKEMNTLDELKQEATIISDIIENENSSLDYDVIKNLGLKLEEKGVLFSYRTKEGKILADTWEENENTKVQSFTRVKQKTKKGGVITIGREKVSMLEFAKDAAQGGILIIVLLMGISAFLSFRVSKKIVEPINNLNLKEPMENNIYDELTPLLMHMDRQNKEILYSLEKVKQGQKEFEALANNLNEGLFMLDRKRRIVSMNRSSKGLYGIEKTPRGQNIIFVDRSPELSNALDKAFEKGKSEVMEKRGERSYLYRISSIVSSEYVIGYAILIIDVTEKEAVATMRREFTANVSHELKSPLQAIIGSADLLLSGMAREEDREKFLRHIESNGRKLLMLIDDTIKLSLLDEGQAIKAERIDVITIINDIVSGLMPLIEEKNINFSLRGANGIIMAPRKIVHDIIYNVIDNGIKYNSDGGILNVSVDESDGEVVLTVEDSGIGISKDDFDRIFERFYRGDKSHSKKIEGTGLGLSIVKHGVELLHGSIDLDSRQGQGTKFKISLPMGL